MHGLSELRVVDFSSGIAGPYATKLLVDAGAEVVKVEAGDGDPLRRWSATGGDLAGADSALFQFLNASKKSIRGKLDDPRVQALLAGADLLVDDESVGESDALDLCHRFPHLVWLSITPFGHGGPLSEVPATEFTVQAEAGAIAVRGLAGREPFQAGGRTTEWIGGTYAAVAALAAVLRARRGGGGERIDFSLAEVMNIAASNFGDLFWSLNGRPPVVGSMQSVESPSVEPTADGYVGFCTNSAQQFSDFLLLIGRPDLREDKDLFQPAGRMARFEEWTQIVHAYTRAHTTAEIVEQASLLRIPVSPVNDGDRVREHEQLKARGVFLDQPGASFLRPRPPYRIDGELPMPPVAAPRLFQHDTSQGPWEAREAPAPQAERALPLAGLRVFDATAWWAGPAASHMLASLGADVVHVESIQRPDGMRMAGGAFYDRERWWEQSAFFLASNTNKRGITLDLTRSEGVEVAKKLIARSDIVIENFTPRVMDGFGLGWEEIQAQNPNAIFVRMPAFGLDGPWRDHTGFAQTMEQMTGLAWLTGHRDDQPRIQRGPCDPLAGMHAVFALLVALEERRVKRRGVFVECAMVEGALNAAAEQLVEFTAYGNRMQRQGNRSYEAAPQGLYPCRGHTLETPRWLALSVATDAQWDALRVFLGDPEWARDEALTSLSGRRANHDRIDVALGPFFAERERDETIQALLRAGVPAGHLTDARASSEQLQFCARGFHEVLDHPVAGAIPHPGLPFRYASVASWLRCPAPTLGQHNREVLEELGYAREEIHALEAAKIIGTRPEGL
ncbi:MAG: CoA transferase [Myxococcota bacterium]